MTDQFSCLIFYQYYMKRFATKIVQMMKKEKLFASQGGPIILSQVRSIFIAFI